MFLLIQKFGKCFSFHRSTLVFRNAFNILQRKFSHSVNNRSPTTTSKQNKNELVKIEVDSQTQIATLTMNRSPANALSLEMITTLRESIEELENRKALGIILTSSSNRIFCAGLDLNEVYRRDEESLTQLWTSLQNLWRTLFSTRIPTAVLINGHALAGGCMLAIACNYRVILPNVTIGLNETRAGVVVPLWVMDTYLNVVRSRRIAEADMIEGKSYKSADALHVGIIDAVVDAPDEGFEKCMEFLCHFNGPTRAAMAKTKSDFRADILENFAKYRKKDLSTFLKVATSAEFQEFLGAYLKSLKEKSVRKKA